MQFRCVGTCVGWEATCSIVPICARVGGWVGGWVGVGVCECVRACVRACVCACVGGEGGGARSTNCAVPNIPKNYVGDRRRGREVRIAARARGTDSVVASRPLRREQGLPRRQRLKEGIKGRVYIGTGGAGADSPVGPKSLVRYVERRVHRDGRAAVRGRERHKHLRARHGGVVVNKAIHGSLCGRLLQHHVVTKGSVKIKVKRGVWRGGFARRMIGDQKRGLARW